MAIVAYASSQANPITSRVDAFFNQTDLPVASVSLYGAGLDTGDPSATFAFTWVLLKKPTGSSAAIPQASLQNTTLESIGVWGNYRVFLIVTNTSTGETSETDPVKAPASAFVHVRVLSEHLNLQKPAAGERDWQSIAHTWVEKLEEIGGAIGDAQGLPVEAGGTTAVIGLAGDVSYTINGTAGEIEVSAISSPTSFDITVAMSSPATTPGSLTVSDELNCAGDLNIAEGQNIFCSSIKGGAAPYGSLMYEDSTWKINRASIAGQESEILLRSDVPSTSARAGVLLEDTAGNASAKILTREYFTWHAASEYTIRHVAGQNNATKIEGVQAFVGTDISTHAAVFWRNLSDHVLTLDTLQLHLSSGGSIGNGSEYVFRAAVASSRANFQNNVYVVEPTDFTVIRVANGAALSASLSKALDVPSGAYLLVLCYANPQYLGQQLSAQVILHREIGA